MKTKFILKGLLTIFFMVACTPHRYLPMYNAIDVNEHGSRIIVNRVDGPTIKGELIAADTSNLIILADSNYVKRIKNTLIVVPTNEIKKYRLRYGKFRDFRWTIPVLSATTPSHGLFFIFSFPVNLILTFAISAGTEAAFEYNDKEISYEDLKMFARFPQGIPSGIDPSSIR